MKYQIIVIENNTVYAEAKRINDSYLIQEVRNGITYGWFQNGIWKLFRDGVEIDPEFVLDQDDKRYDAWLTKKKLTHKQIYVNTGVAGLPQNRNKIWVKK